MLMVKNVSNDDSDKQAQLEHERLSSLINSMADGVIAINQEGNVVLYNGAALNILDINSTVTGLPIAKVFHIIDQNGQPIDVSALVKATKTPTTNRDYRMRYQDGSIINLYVSLAPVHLGYGHASDQGYVLLFRDITREKSLEEERNEFISVVSHELRTPVTIAEGNLGNALFITDKLSGLDEIKSALKQAHEQVVFLSDMINDLSTLSRAEQSRLQVDVEPINVHKLVSSLEANYEPQAKQKDVYIRSEIDAGLELLYSSKLYVREILQNFITNAIKYTEKGGVTVSAKPVSDGVLFRVTDTGIGITRSDQERVWDKFFRSEDFRTRQTNGTGLGLYVTMKLARLIHADIRLESEFDKGSTFEISIPNLNI